VALTVKGKFSCRSGRSSRVRRAGARLHLPLLFTCSLAHFAHFAHLLPLSLSLGFPPLSPCWCRIILVFSTRTIIPYPILMILLLLLLLLLLPLARHGRWPTPCSDCAIFLIYDTLQSLLPVPPLITLTRDLPPFPPLHTRLLHI